MLFRHFKKAPPSYLKTVSAFALIELAIVLVILGLLIGASIPLYSELTKQKHARTTDRDLGEIKEALAGFAGIYGRMPYADTDGDGIGDTNQPTGTIPYLDLGLGSVDAWRSPYLYDVNDRLIVTTDSTSLCAALSGIVPGESPQLAFAAGGLPTSQAVIVISRGPNSSLDSENGDGDRVYESFTPTDTFDDMVVALNTNVLHGKFECGGTAGGPTTSCTRFRVRNRSGGAQIWVKGGSYADCTRRNNNQRFDVYSGQTVYIFTSSADCTAQATSPTLVTFNSCAAIDTDTDCNVRWNGTALIDE